MKPLQVMTLGVLLTLLAGCGTVSPPAPAHASSTVAFSSPVHAAHGRNLLYISNLGALYVYTYPSLKFIGVLEGASGPRGICANLGGDIFVPFVYIPGGIYEYSHGEGSPIADLGLMYDWPNGCSVSPKTGALAVVAGPNHYGSAVAVYHYGGKHGYRFATGYSISSMMHTYFCGFDGNGNLFVDGVDSNGNFALAELPRGGKAFVAISVTQTMAPGQVQWDGKHLAIGDTAAVSPSVIYQFDVSGTSATAVGSTTLAGSQQVAQFWIQGRTIVAPDPKRSCGSSDGCVALYHYPAGGEAFNKAGLLDAFGAAVSLAP